MASRPSSSGECSHAEISNTNAVYFFPLAETDDEQRKSELPYTYHKLLLETQSDGRMMEK